MRKECWASGTWSSASLKRRLRRRRKVAPRGRQDAAAGARVCSVAVSSLLGSNRVVRRILTACVLSFLALLGSVSFDLRSSLSSLRTTEDAHQQLTSCRTAAILQLVSRLQQMRHSLGNHTPDGDAVAAVSQQACGDASGGQDGRGRPCGAETAAVCEQLRRDVGGLGNVSLSSAYSLAIERLLDSWGTLGDSLQRVRQDLLWRDVLSARLLLAFIELNQQLRDAGGVAADRWSCVLSHLGVAAVLSERLRQCWLDEVVPKVNGSRGGEDALPFEAGPWRLPAAGAEALPGSAAGLEALRDAQRCLLGGAAAALQRAARAASSELSVRLCCLLTACLIYPLVMFSFKQMTEWIQNFAQNLKERTEDLKLQRQLAEDLLHQMLPRSVAKQLRQHQHVEAESYDKVTIFFSDIVGFTSISASCSPLQVVEMLNNLYMCFDTRIDSYDVYKVETIGDAYMVVSGLPDRNGDRHADEIAKMALDLVAAVRQVSIPHMPEQRLQLRAGIHTGPCVAGIVGYKMPRYCLFGDTVNTASRMESTSLPQMIHTSSETYLALIRDDAYELQLRGEIEVKGKGRMKTYWLVGHKNYSVQNDSLVCHWNPSKARKKKAAASGEEGAADASPAAAL